MQQKWSLQVENFGRIQKAEITMSPMLLFVGKNSTGKSYIASLIWGLMDYQDVFPNKIPSGKQYNKCKNYFISHYEEKKERLDKDFIKSLISLYNTFLQEKKDTIVRQLFSSDDIKIEHLSIKIKDNDIIDSPINWVEDDMYMALNGSNFLYDSSIEFSEKDIYSFIRSLTLILLYNNYTHPLYMPASRTGFMLSYKTLAANLMETWGIDKQVKSHFPLTIIRFLQNLTLTEIDEQPIKTKIIEIAESLEREIIEGEIKQSPVPGSGFYYMPVLTNKPLPFHITSSLVSELAPLIIFLKGRRKGFIHPDSIIFEEPESHLHLKAQIVLAKSLVRLANNNVSVCITTHSDIFFQKINNLIATSKEKQKLLKKLSYNDDEIIKQENINAYQFNINDKGFTETSPLELTEEGFIIPTFNETIWEISKETMELETDSEDAE